MNDNPVLRIVAKIIIPMILIFGLYVQFHGDFGPGGGFQAGVIVAAGIILFAMVFGLQRAREVAPPAVVHRLVALGLMLYTGVGFGQAFAVQSDLVAHRWRQFSIVQCELATVQPVSQISHCY